MVRLDDAQIGGLPQPVMDFVYVGLTAAFFALTWVHDRPGGGTLFRIVLPLDGEPPPVADEWAP